MKLDGRRESSNVDDRRRMGGGAKAGLGIGAILLAAVVGYFSGGTEGAINAVVNEVAQSQHQTTATNNREFTAEEQELATSKAATLEALMGRMAAEGRKELNLVVKSDTQGSLEAIVEALGQIKSEKVSLRIIDTGTGNVSLTDVKSAAAGKADVVGFDIGTDAGVQSQARHDGVKINSFRIIYELFDFVKQSLLDLLDPEYKEVVKGHAQIRQIFDIGKLGKVAGCQLLDGSVLKSAFVRIKRLREVLFQGKIASLKHFKDEVNEVHDMQEFGVSFVDFEDFAEGDIIECYAMEELERTL